VAKVFGHFITQNYREAYGLHATSGILFNHESPLRGEEFVTRKITSTLARIAAGSNEVLMLGNLDASRDWGHAADYVRGMWLMTDAPTANDFILATGVTTTVREFVVKAAKALELDLEFSGDGVDEVAKDGSGRVLVKVNPQHFRPAEVEMLVGDASKARRDLGWTPTYDLDALVADMVASDQRRAAEHSR
jgi:GDPmannose 4,6-dehydratase